jgi:prepilin-type N-terminal cleavage/methylation domain-containing protein/prepilin-type processing-associated H-X9-DG protein
VIGAARRAAGFTLLELLVALTIMLVLVSLLATSLGQVRGASRKFVCSNKLKTVAFEFAQFADGFAHPYRGRSEAQGKEAFRIDDFQERLYRIDEFWDAGGRAEVACDPSREWLMCPSGPQVLQRRSGLPCTGYAVGPPENVSMAVNMRLAKASVLVGGRYVLKDVVLRERILQRSMVPLAFDVEGGEAAARDVLPYYSAPPTSEEGRYHSGLFWFPALRHGGKVNACFVGGHVSSSRIPAEEPDWNWKYQPPPE